MPLRSPIPPGSTPPEDFIFRSQTPRRFYIIPGIRCLAASNPQEHSTTTSLSWFLVLAGFLLLPGSFTSKPLFPREELDGNADLTVKNVSVVYAGAISFFIGAFGICRVWWLWNQYKWFILYQVFLPGVLNSLLGILSIIINVYTAQSRTWSLLATIDGITSMLCILVFGGLYFFLLFREQLIIRSAVNGP